MKHKIKYETKKKIREIVSAASNKDETLYKLLINEVEDRAERIKINLQLKQMPPLDYYTVEMPKIAEETKQVEIDKAVRNDSSCLYTFDSDMN